ncbi:hypothetical protein D3C78_1341660 [compost metagenome]
MVGKQVLRTQRQVQHPDVFLLQLRQFLQVSGIEQVVIAGVGEQRRDALGERQTALALHCLARIGTGRRDDVEGIGRFLQQQLVADALVGALHQRIVRQLQAAALHQRSVDGIGRAHRALLQQPLQMLFEACALGFGEALG